MTYSEHELEFTFANKTKGFLHVLQDKGGAYHRNSDSTRQRIISGSGLEICVYTNRILTKLCRQKLYRGSVNMERRVGII